MSFSFLALFALMLLGTFLALFIYAIVAKKYWLTFAMLVLPSLLVVLCIIVISFKRTVASRAFEHEAALAEQVETLSARRAEANTNSEEIRVPLPDKPWSATLPPKRGRLPKHRLMRTSISVSDCSSNSKRHQTREINSQSALQKRVALATAINGNQQKTSSLAFAKSSCGSFPAAPSQAPLKLTIKRRRRNQPVAAANL